MMRPPRHLYRGSSLQICVSIPARSRPVTVSRGSVGRLYACDPRSSAPDTAINSGHTPFSTT